MIDDFYPVLTTTYFPMSQEADAYFRAAVLDNKFTKKILPTLIETTIDEDDRMVTAVHWNDDTVTVVKHSLDEDENTESMYTAFVYAYAKKMFGSNSRIQKMVDELQKDRLEEKAKIEKQKRVEEKEEEQRRAHAKRIRKLAKRMRDEEEASNYNLAIRPQNRFNLKGIYHQG